MLFWCLSTSYLIWDIALKRISLIFVNSKLMNTDANAWVSVQATSNLHNVFFTVRCQSTKIWSRVTLQSSHYIKVRSHMKWDFKIWETKKRDIRRDDDDSFKFRWHFSIILDDSRYLINMRKRKRKLKQQQSFIFSSSFSFKSTTMQDKSQSKKRCFTFSSQISTSAIQFQAISQMNNCSLQINKKLWNWFYESLILLLTYDKSQKKRVKMNETSFKEYLNDDNKKTLSKKFLNELAYICNYSLDEDIVTTIAI
jgi:hypothetical protein